jgi:hypothetical protein
MAKLTDLVATDVELTTSVSNLVDSSPSTLNTLNELAAALGDDANFSTTVTNSIATKMPLAGGTFTGDVTFDGATAGRDIVFDRSTNSLDFADNARLSIGTDGDFELYHNGSNLLLYNLTGANFFRSNRFAFSNTSGTLMADMYSGGKVGLHFSGAEKLSTTSSGVTVTGTLAATALTGDGSGLTNLPASSSDLVDDGSPQLGGALQLNGNNIQANDSTGVTQNRIQLGTSQDLQLYHNGTNSIIENTTGQLDIINSAENQDVVIKSDDGFGNLSEYFRADGSNGSARLFHYGSEKIATRGDGVVITGDIINTSGAMTVDVAGNLALDVGGATIFFKDDGATWGYIQNQTTDGAFDIKSSTNNYDMRFRGTDNGSTITALTLDMSDAGTAIFNHDIKLPDNGKAIFGAGSDLKIYHDGSNSYVSDTGTGGLRLTGSSTRIFDAFNTEYAKFNALGSVLYHNGSQKLTTSSSGISVTGDIAVTGNVDGRDVAADGTKLDGIAAGANVGIPTTGGTFTGDVAHSDNVKAKFGTGNDLNIYHDGSYSWIEHTGTGNLIIKTGFNKSISLNPSISGESIVAKGNGSAALYYQGVEKLITNTSGVTVTGTLAATAVTGDGSGLTGLAAGFVGSDNIVGGTNAGSSLSSLGRENVFFGYAAGEDVTSGDYNSLIGRGSGATITTGNHNVAIGGYGAMGIGVVTGEYNIAIGTRSLEDLTSAMHNIGIGVDAGKSITTGQNNVALGQDSLQSVTTANGNTALGAFAGAGNSSTFGNNTYVGYGAGRYCGNSTQNIFVGKQAGRQYTGENTIIIGVDAGDQGSSTGQRNTIMGNFACGGAALSGGDNLVLGYNAGYVLSSGTYNTFVGRDSGNLVTTGSKNTIIGGFDGNQGGLDIRTSSNNIVLSDGDGNTRVWINSAGHFQAQANEGYLNIKSTDPNTALDSHLVFKSSFTGLNNSDDITAEIIGAPDASTGGRLIFKTTYIDGTVNEHARMDAAGNFMVGKVLASFGNATGNDGFLIQPSNNTFHIQTNGNTPFSINRRSSTGSLIHFYYNTSVKGNIATNGSSVQYNTVSDYRLKENVVEITGATERLKQLEPKRFNFIEDPDDTTVDGFLAHEVQAVVPEAITGTKDAMRDEEYEVTPAVIDEDGNVTTEAVMGTRSVPDYQGIDQSKLVPLLVATIQELEARITALESA